MEITFSGVVVPLFILLPIILALFRWKMLPSEGKVIFYYLLISAITNTVATVVAKVFHTNNMPAIHIYTILEVIILTIFFYKLLSQSKTNFFYTFFILGFILLSIANAVFFQNIFTYCSYTRSIAAICLMIFSVNYFAKIAAEEKNPYLLANFYFNTGIFLYYSGAFMLFAFSNFTIFGNVSRNDFNIIWNLHAALLLIMYIFFTIGIQLCKK